MYVHPTVSALSSTVPRVNVPTGVAPRVPFISVAVVAVMLAVCKSVVSTSANVIVPVASAGSASGLTKSSAVSVTVAACAADVIVGASFVPVTVTVTS